MKSTKKVIGKIMAGWICIMGVSGTVGCVGDDDAVDITVTGSATAEVPAVTNQSTTLSFNAGGSWKASCDASWLTLSPREGESGSNTITLTTTQTNRTKSLRSASLTITSGSTKKTVTVRQKDEYAIFDKDEYEVEAEGGVINVSFVTNVTDGRLRLYGTESLSGWVESRRSVATRAEAKGYFNAINVSPNTSKQAREGAFFLGIMNSSDELMALDTLHIRQKGIASGYTSTDYSADGLVEQICHASEGNGVDIVIMGDGFTDVDVSNGTYDSIMNCTVDKLFSEEPIRSMKQYFNVHRVTTVSANDAFGDGYSTALGSVPDMQTTGVTADTKKVLSYVKKAGFSDKDDVLVVVILNTNLHKGVTYLYSDSRNVPINYAIAFCALIDGAESEMFREVLTHEAIGHGLAKLGDEYVDSKSGSATDDDISDMKRMHGYNWFMNIDTESDATKTVWGSFVGDERFTSENISTFEGAFTFYKGMYRSTENSMMNVNDSPFNAPSRRAIYNKVMKLAFDREPDYEEFAVFDSAHKPTVWHYDSSTQTRNAWAPKWNPCIRWQQLP
ncbi:MAG: hypothetical protein IJP74_10405 [Prevotella sp.]|nr:hypothetical protein [Prevotella sp.]